MVAHGIPGGLAEGIVHMDILKANKKMAGGGSGVAAYHVLPTTPPTLANTNAFTAIPADCIIYVPAASLAAYQAATNWSTYASRMVGE